MGLGRVRGCMDQVFAVRQVCEKYLANGIYLFWAFMDLEKAYDKIDRQGMWQMLSADAEAWRMRSRDAKQRKHVDFF